MFARTQQELDREGLLAFLRARKRDMDLDWEMFECKKPPPPGARPTSPKPSATLNHLGHLDRYLCSNLTCVAGDIDPGAEGTEAAHFHIEFCWRFDRFILRARPIMTNELLQYNAGRLQARMEATQGGRYCTYIR